MIGQIVSHYKILEKLGEGGMGVVYKAEDTNLDRVVALKFMPHHVTPDEAEEARFLQEAKAASALNHPNVCTIYGIDAHGADRFIEMEFVEGTTLRQKIPLGSLDDAIRYGIQIGDALHEAHSKGIVHRDIKSDNIMINARDQVKVMDFGLAKLKGSLRLTKATSTVGTLAYMPPEQIQGGEVDARSDIFSYGVLLYEMISGRLPYKSEHEAALMYSILNEEPEPIEKYREGLPPVLTNLIARALEKDPNDRYQSINEMVIELRRLQKKSSRVSRPSMVTGVPAGTVPSIEPGSPGGRSSAQDIPVGGGTGSSASMGAAPPPPKKNGMLIGAAVAVVAVLAAVWYFVFGPSSRVEINPNMTFKTLQVPVREVSLPSLSKDGGWVAFAGSETGAAWDVYLMNTGSGDPRQITDDSLAYAGNVDLSPDGSQIVYDRSDKDLTKPEIAVISSLGGVSKRIVNVGFYPKWRPDGERIAYVINSAWGSASGQFEFRSVKPNGTDDRLEFIDSLDMLPYYSWSPDGKSVCLSRRLATGNIELYIHDLASGNERQLTSLGKYSLYPSWTRDNEIIFTSDIIGNRNLWIMPVSGGEPVQITRGSGPDIAPAVSGDGKRVMFVQAQSVGKVWLASLEGGPARQLTFEDVNIYEQDLTDDGKRILYTLNTPSPDGGTNDLFVMEIGTGRKSLVMSAEDSFHDPKWSPDGKWIAYATHPDSVDHDSSDAFVVEADNPGTPRRVGPGFPLRWLDDRTFLATRPYGTFLCTIDGSPAKMYMKDSTWVQPVLDGKYIVYQDVIIGRNPGIWIEPAPSPGGTGRTPRQLIKALANPVYNEATRSLFFVSAQGDFRRISLPDGKETIVSGDFPHLRPIQTISLGADGKRMTYIDSKDVRKIVMIENLR